MTDRRATRSQAPAASSPRNSGPPVVAVALAVLVVVIAVGVAIALAGGSDEGSGGDEGLAFGAVTVDGAVLPAFETGEADAAEGQLAPTLTGQAVDGARTIVGSGEPTIVAFLAHWCPHCRAELPRIVGAAADGAFDGVRLVAVLTGTNPDAPNFPPGRWLDRERWPGDVLVDDEAGSAATGYGLAGYPFLVVLDAEGHVVTRTSGELGSGRLAALGDLARGGRG